MTLSTKRILLSTGVAAAVLGGLAAPAPAAEFKYVPVPEGKIEHTVELIDFTASYTVKGQVPRYERVERWIGRARAREIHTDRQTGRLTHECVADAARTRCWNPDDGVIDVGPGPSGGDQSRWQTRDGDAYFLRGMVGDGWYAKGGETTVNGRPATIFHNTDAMPSAASELESELVVDSETFRLWSETVEFTERSSKGTSTGKQTRVYTVDELLDESAVGGFRLAHQASKARKAKSCKRFKRAAKRKACRRAAKRASRGART